MPDVALVGALVTLAAAIGGIISGVASYLIRRRAQSGQVATSDARTLWDQSQEMRAQLLAQLIKVEEQRDKLLEVATGQVSPAFAEINASLKLIVEGMSELNKKIGHLDRRVGDMAKGDIKMSDVEKTVADMITRLNRIPGNRGPD